MTYTVTFGSLINENGYWNISGMVASQDHEFETLEEAMEFFNGYDVAADFETEWGTACVKPKNRGFYAEVWTMIDDYCADSIAWKQYTADDHYANDK